MAKSRALFSHVSTWLTLIPVAPQPAHTPQPLTIPSTFFILSIPWRYLTPHIPFLNPKALTDWSTRFARYDRLGATVTKTTTLWTGKSTVWLAEPRAVKVVSIDRRSWSKPTEMYEVRWSKSDQAIEWSSCFRRR